jgi:hypothetical protein
MLNRNVVLLVAGAAMVTATAAGAQRPTSTKRIPVSKEAPGEVAARVDTVTVYRTDTLRMQGRVDTLRLTNTVTQTRVDTVVQNVPMVARHIGGMYFGLGGGVAMPYGAIRTVNQPGELAQVNLGWQGLHSVLGIRLDGTWNRYARNPDYVNLNVPASSGSVGRPMVWTGNAGLRLNLPFFNHTLGSSVLMTPYLIGGGSYIHYSDLRMKVDRDNTSGQAITVFGGQQAVFATDVDNTTTTGDASNWGFYGGGGIGFHAGKKEIFVESRAIGFRHGGNNVNGSNTFERSWNVPIVFGVNFF